jgi:predicted DNA-binding protein with PD1-like motif
MDNAQQTRHHKPARPFRLTPEKGQEILAAIEAAVNDNLDKVEVYWVNGDVRHAAVKYASRATAHGGRR